MSIPTLMNALTQGFNANQIIQWLSSNSKKLSKHIKAAKLQGYTEDQILQYLTKGKYASHGQRQEMTEGMTEQEKSTKILNRPTDWSKLAKGLGTAATVAGGIYGATQAIPAIAKGTQALLQRAGGVAGKPIGPQPMGNAPVQPPAVPPVGGTQAVTVPTGQQTTTAQAPSPPSAQPLASTTPFLPPGSSKAIIDQMNIGSQIQSLHKAGNDPQTVSAAINSILKPHQKTWLNEQIKAGKAKPMEEMVKDYLAETPTEEQKPIEQPKAAPKIVKGNTVITPEGEVGDVKSERNGKALVDVNGKLTEHKVDKLQDLYEKYKDVHIDVSHIPESERSGPLYGIRTANDNKNLLVEFFPKNSEVSDNEWEYFRKDGNKLEDSLLNSLQEGMTIPVTSGVEWSGFWSEEDADSRGSAFHHNLKLLAQDKNAVESGEEQNDPSKPYWYVKKKSLFRHGYEREARRQFGKHQKEFKKEHKEMTGGKKRRTEER